MAGMESYLHGWRLGKAIGMLVVLIGSAILWVCINPGKAISTQTQSATVAAVYEKAYLVTLPDGRQARVFRQGNQPVGDLIPVRVTTYENGETAVDPLYDDTP